MLLFFVLSGEFCVCRLCRRSEVPLQKAGLSYSTGLEALAGTPFSIPLPSLAWHFAKAPAASCARWIWGEGGCAFKGRPGSMRKIFGEAIADIDGGYAGRRYNARRFYYQTFAENGRSEPCEAALMPSGPRRFLRFDGTHPKFEHFAGDGPTGCFPWFRDFLVVADGRKRHSASQANIDVMTGLPKTRKSGPARLLPLQIGAFLHTNTNGRLEPADMDPWKRRGKPCHACQRPARGADGVRLSAGMDWPRQRSAPSGSASILAAWNAERTGGQIFRKRALRGFSRRLAARRERLRRRGYMEIFSLVRPRSIPEQRAPHGGDEPWVFRAQR